MKNTTVIINSLKDSLQEFCLDIKQCRMPF